jgi:hypothetical protein
LRVILKLWINGKFVRRTVTKQKFLEAPASKLVRILFRNEFPEFFNSASKNEVIQKLGFSLNNLAVKFPTPSSLSFSNINEQISGAKEIIEFVSDTLMLDAEVNNVDFPRLFKKNIAKNLLVSIDWEKFEEIKNMAIEEQQRLNLEKDNEEEEDMGGMGADDMGGMGADDMGGMGADDMGGMGADDMGGMGAPAPTANTPNTPNAQPAKDFSTTPVQTRQDMKAAKTQIMKGSDEEKELNSIEKMEKDI